LSSAGEVVQQNMFAGKKMFANLAHFFSPHNAVSNSTVCEGNAIFFIAYLKCQECFLI
jgi:hypothetical protein